VLIEYSGWIPLGGYCVRQSTRKRHDQSIRSCAAVDGQRSRSRTCSGGTQLLRRSADRREGRSGDYLSRLPHHGRSFSPGQSKDGDVEKFPCLLRRPTKCCPTRRAAASTIRGAKSRTLSRMPNFRAEGFCDRRGVRSEPASGSAVVAVQPAAPGPERPAVSLPPSRTPHGVPARISDFTMWFLRAKGYVTAADNADYTISASGAEFVKRMWTRASSCPTAFFPTTHSKAASVLALEIAVTCYKLLLNARRAGPGVPGPYGSVVGGEARLALGSREKAPS